MLGFSLLALLALAAVPGADASMPDQDGGDTIVLDYNQKQYGIGGGPMKLTDSEDPVDRAFGPFAASDLSSWPEGQYDRIAGAARALQTAVVAAHYSQPYVADAFGLTRWEAFPLDQLGNTQGANRLKRLQNLAAFIKGESPGRLRRGPLMTEKARKRLVLFVRLFLMGIAVKAKAVVKALGSDVVRVLMDDLGLLSYDGASRKKMLVSNMQIAPVAEDLLITTDFIQRKKSSSLEPVMYIGLDSQGLVWAAPREVRRRIMSSHHIIPFIHPLYTCIAVYAPMCTRYTCIYIIYTPNTPHSHPTYTLYRRRGECSTCARAAACRGSQRRDITRTR